MKGRDGQGLVSRTDYFVSGGYSECHTKKNTWSDSASACFIKQDDDTMKDENTFFDPGEKQDFRVLPSRPILLSGRASTCVKGYTAIFCRFDGIQWWDVSVETVIWGRYLILKFKFLFLLTPTYALFHKYIPLISCKGVFRPTNQAEGKVVAWWVEATFESFQSCINKKHPTHVGRLFIICARVGWCTFREGGQYFE